MDPEPEPKAGSGVRRRRNSPRFRFLDNGAAQVIGPDGVLPGSSKEPEEVDDVIAAWGPTGLKLGCHGNRQKPGALWNLLAERALV